MRHLMSPLDLSVEELDKVLDLANDIEKNPEKYAHKCDGKILATLFYEPSTRTRLSFESAMLRLGGKVLGFSSANSSSAAKGESVADTLRMISCYADICAMRHPKEGAPLVGSMASQIPVINAGDGGHQHSHPDPDRSAYYPFYERPSGPYYYWSVRRSEVRKDGSFPDRGPGEIRGRKVCADLSGGTADTGLYQRRCVKGQRP